MPPVALTANGDQFGNLQLVSTSGFRVKQVVTLSNNSGHIQVQVKKVTSSTALVVGNWDNKITKYGIVDASSYTVASNSKLSAGEQPKNNIPESDHYTAIYEADPVVADRVIQVDQFGNFITPENPLPTTFDGTITVGDVEIKGPSGNFLDPNADGSVNAINIGALVPVKFDEIDLTNVTIAGQTVPSVVVYKSSGNVVATLTLSYDGTANLTKVSRS